METRDSLDIKCSWLSPFLFASTLPGTIRRKGKKNIKDLTPIYTSIKKTTCLFVSVFLDLHHINTLLWYVFTHQIENRCQVSLHPKTWDMCRSQELDPSRPSRAERLRRLGMEEIRLTS